MAQKIVYNHKAIEKKWRENWEKNPVNVQFDENGNIIRPEVAETEQQGAQEKPIPDQSIECAA